MVHVGHVPVGFELGMLISYYLSPFCLRKRECGFWWNMGFSLKIGGLFLDDK